MNAHEITDTIELLKEQKPQARWITERPEPGDFAYRRYTCSACGTWQTYGKTPYCPYCGARMEGVKDVQPE